MLVRIDWRSIRCNRLTLLHVTIIVSLLWRAKKYSCNGWLQAAQVWSLEPILVELGVQTVAILRFLTQLGFRKTCNQNKAAGYSCGYM